MCVSPLSIPRPGGAGARDRITVPCAKCHECLASKRQDWCQRLEQERKNSVSCFFITLTYDDDNFRMQLDKRDIQLFLKRLRESEQFRYFCCGEYGSRTYRPHYHMIMFFDHYISDDMLNSKILEKWDKGFIKIMKCNEKMIGYTTKYILKSQDFTSSTFLLCSRKPGIGDCYIRNNKNIKYLVEHDNQLFISKEDGVKQRLSRFYRDKIYSSDQRKVVFDELQKVRDRLANKDRLNYDQSVSYGENQLNKKKNEFRKIREQRKDNEF